jgi:hypothetical protein
MRPVRSFAGGVTMLLCAVWLNAAPMHPIERHLRDAFPSVPVDASATFDAAEETVGGSVVPGLRAHFAQASVEPGLPGVPEAMAQAGGPVDCALQVTWPRYYSDPLVATFGDQRVVLRAVRARGAVAASTNGKLIYQDAYGSVDAVEVPGTGRDEELLLLRDREAPLVYDYEIVEMRGVSAAVMDGGAVRFLPDASKAPTTTQVASGRCTPLPRTLQLDRPWLVDASGRRSETSAKWTLVGDSKTPRTLRLTLSAEGLAYPLVVDPTVSISGSLGTARRQHTATLLPNGKVLFAGGSISSGYTASAELYDPLTGSFTPTGSLITARAGHTATLLPNGKVLVAGGFNGSQLASAELYDPASGTFSATTGSLGTARNSHTATLLPNGKVLIVAGLGPVTFLQSAELFDPSTGLFSPTAGSLTNARTEHAAALLQNGKVLIVGGVNSIAYLQAAELFDPSTGMFGATGSLGTGRRDPTATLLPSGKVLVTGGFNGSYLATAELYDPTGGGTFSLTTGAMSAGRDFHTATLLPGGGVLVTGGINPGYQVSTELYDPVASTFSFAGFMAVARDTHTATLLPNGTVLIAGGANVFGPVSSAELWAVAGGLNPPTGALATGRNLHSATLLPNGKVLIAGGYDGSVSTTSAELYNPAGSGTFSTTGSLATGRYWHTSTLLSNGKALIAGGYSTVAASAQSSAELYDPGSSGFTAAGPLAAARYSHTATLLPNGKVLIAGGLSTASGVLSSAELFDPGSGPNGTFSVAGSMSTARMLHSATLLPDGKVLIAGGTIAAIGGAAMSSAELYDPANGTFTPTGSLNTARCSHTATLLSDGKVLIAGGSNGVNLASAELYDPASGTFSRTGSMTTARNSHSATMMPTGKVLMTCGFDVNGNYLSSAELYDPIGGAFTVTGGGVVTRAGQTATLLPTGNVLVAGGFNGSYPTSADLLDVSGLGYAGTRRPVVSSPAALMQPAAIVLSGSGFRGDSEASSGSVSASSTNYPILQLQRVDNDQMMFVSNGANWNDTNFTSTTLSGLAGGPYRLTIYTNAIPSLQSIVSISTAAPTISNVSPNLGPASGGQSVTISGTNLAYAGVMIGGNAATVTGVTTTTVTFTTPPHAPGAVGVSVAAAGGSVTSTGPYTYVAAPTITGINPSIGPATGGQLVTITGTNLSNLTSVTIGGAAASIVANTAISITVGTPSGAPGAADVVVTTVGGSVTSTGGYIYVAFGAPTFFSATATSTSQVALSWVAVTGATGYEVWRATLLNGPYILVSSPAGTSTNDTGLSASTTYLYKVRAIGSGYPSGFSPIDPATTIVFTDPSLSGVVIQAVHINELRTAVNAMQVAAGLSASTFTDPTLTAGSTVIKAVHLTDLRAALDAARSTLGLAAIAYTDPTITTGVTVMKAAHLTELRAGTQ